MYYLVPAGVLLLIFLYNLYSKLRSKHTIGLHRHPTNTRRGHRELPQYHTDEYRVLIP